MNRAQYPNGLDPKRVRLFRCPRGTLRLTITGDRSCLRVQVARGAPLSDPDHYIAILDEADEEVCMMENPEELDEASLQTLREELARRYMTALVEKVYSVRSESGASYFDVQTHRGRREFVVQHIQESARWLGERRLLLVDVDGNRFEIPDLHALDKTSARLLQRVL